MCIMEITLHSFLQRSALKLGVRCVKGVCLVTASPLAPHQIEQYMYKDNFSFTPKIHAQILARPPTANKLR